MVGSLFHAADAHPREEATMGKKKKDKKKGKKKKK